MMRNSTGGGSTGRFIPRGPRAEIFVSVFGPPADRTKTLAALNDAAGYIQEALGRGLTTRRTPRVVFVDDDSIREAAKLSQVIQEARAEDERAAAARGDPEAGVEAPSEDTETP